MPAARPFVVVLAGPNGAGKSTMAAQLLVDVLVAEFVDADVLAQAMPRASGAAVGAGRVMLAKLNQLSADRENFGFETTLASRSFGPRIRGLIKAGYHCHLIFLWLPSADLAVARVADRVRLGGHAVPEETVRRRYESGLRNFFELYRSLTTTWRMYDNSTHEPRLIASRARTGTVTVDDAVLWARIMVEAHAQR